MEKEKPRPANQSGLGDCGQGKGTLTDDGKMLTLEGLAGKV